MILKNLIYIYQLENYDKKRFLIFSYKNFNWFFLNKRGSLDWTTRAILIYFLSSFFILLVAFYFYFISFLFMAACLFICFLMLPFIIIISDFFISPLILFQKNKIIKNASKIIDLNKKRGLITIGITGSFGKTSMKNILGAVLSEKYKIFSFPGNINTDIGVSRYLINNKDELENANILISEMGAYKKGDIKKLCDVIKPQYSVITAIGESHLERFGSFENIISAKFELANNTEKKVFLNTCDKNIEKYFQNKIKKDVVVSKICGRKEVDNIEYLKDFEGISFIYKNKQFKTKLIADYVVDFSVIAMNIADELGLNNDEKQKGLGKLDFVPHRLEVIRNKNLNRIVIDDSYNGNYNGFLEGLNILNRATGRRVVLTPGIVELGKEKSKETHRKLADEYSKKVDLVLLVKNINTNFVVERFKEINYTSFKEYKNILDAHGDLVDVLKNGDVIIFQNDTTDNY